MNPFASDTTTTSSASTADLEAISEKVAGLISDSQEDGFISGPEAEYLSKLAEAAIASAKRLQAGEDLDRVSADLEKSASVGKALRGAVNKVKDPKNLPVIAAGLVAAPAAIRGAKDAGEAVIEPIREEIRYRRAMALPGEEYQVDPDAARQLFIDEENPEIASEKARRKVFEILHRYAPEMTATPEIARQAIEEGLEGGDPSMVADGAMAFQNRAGGNRAVQERVRSERSKRTPSAREALDVLSNVNGLG